MPSLILKNVDLNIFLKINHFDKTCNDQHSLANLAFQGYGGAANILENSMIIY